MGAASPRRGLRCVFLTLNLKHKQKNEANFMAEAFCLVDTHYQESKPVVEQTVGKTEAFCLSVVSRDVGATVEIFSLLYSPFCWNDS